MHQCTDLLPSVGDAETPGDALLPSAGGQFAQAEGIRLQMYEEGAKWPGGANNEARLCYYRRG
jgi:hypothetical protein